MSKLVRKLDADMRKDLINYRENGLKLGWYSGFQSLYEHWTLKRGSTTYILAAPASGKSTFATEIAINLAKYEGLKIMIFSPESGTARDIYSEILWGVLREPFIRHDESKATKSKIEKAMDFVSKHFVVLDNMQRDLNEQLYFDAIREYQEESGEKVDVAILDSVSDVEMSSTAHRDLALSSFLTKMRNLSSHYGVHSILTFHTASLPVMEGKDIHGNKVRYYGKPTADNFFGGRSPYRKAFMLLSLWRSPNGVIDPSTGEPYPSNETHVDILKVKPKRLGKLGTVKLYYDVYANRYYEKDGDKKVFSYPQEPLKLEI